MTNGTPPPARILEDIEASAWADFFRSGGGSVVEFDGVTVFSAPEFPFPDANRAIGLGTRATVTEELLNRTIAVFSPGVPFFLQVPPHVDPPEAHDWIRARGFTPRRRWVKVYRPVQTALPDKANSRGIRVELARNEDAGLFGDTICACFGFPTAMATWFSGLTGRSGWRTYLAFIGDFIAGAAALYSKSDVGTLVAGSALKEFRRRGVQGALIERRIQDAAEAGVTLLVSEAAEDIPEKPNPSLHNLLRLGFREAYKRENYQRLPG